MSDVRPMPGLVANSPMPIAPLTLIVVEDSEDDFDLVVSSLAKSGRRVDARRVETDASLRAALAESVPEAVISDHRLPGFSSFEALRIVRDRDQDLPFVIVSGTIGEQTAVEAMREGASDYLMKDELVRLGPALSRALDNAAARRRRREAEAALIDSEARFRALTANLPGVVFQLELLGERFRLLYVSDGVRRIFGLEPDQVTRHPESLLELASPAESDRLCRELREAGQVAQPFRWIGRLPPREGVSVEWVDVAASARRTGPDRVVWDGIIVDVTPRIRTEHALAASREELRKLAMHLAQVSEREREALSRELHDEVGSMLTGLRFSLAWLKGELKGEPRFDVHIERTEKLVDSAIQASTRIMHDLRPAILDAGIVPALEWLVREFSERIGITAVFHGPPDEPDLGPDESIVVFRICQEALNNAAKHADAKRVDVFFEVTTTEILLDVEDDGRGIAGADLEKTDRYGVRGMRERAASLGGEVEIVRRPEGGTHLRVSLPRA